MASVEHLDFVVAPETVRAFERRALALVIADARLSTRAQEAVFEFGSIDRLCEATQIDLLARESISAISLYMLGSALARRGRYLAVL